MHNASSTLRNSPINHVKNATYFVGVGSLNHKNVNLKTIYGKKDKPSSNNRQVKPTRNKRMELSTQ